MSWYVQCVQMCVSEWEGEERGEWYIVTQTFGQRVLKEASIILFGQSFSFPHDVECIQKQHWDEDTNSDN